MNERTWRFFEWDEDRWVLEHGDGMSVTVLYSNESNRAFLLRILNAHDALVSALEGLFPMLNEFEGQSYGIFLGGDPRDFSPDTECCTPDEIARWEQACAEWEAGEGTDRGPGCATFGDGSAWTGSGFGVGTTTRTQPEIEQARAALRLAKGES